MGDPERAAAQALFERPGLRHGVRQLVRAAEDDHDPREHAARVGADWRRFRSAVLRTRPRAFLLRRFRGRPLDRKPVRSGHLIRVLNDSGALRTRSSAESLESLRNARGGWLWFGTR